MKQFLFKMVMRLAWKLSDDATRTIRQLDEVYEDVPDRFKKEWVRVDYFHTYNKKNRKEILKWLDEE